MTQAKATMDDHITTIIKSAISIKIWNPCLKAEVKYLVAFTRSQPILSAKLPCQPT